MGTMQNLREILYYNTCHINKSEHQLIDDHKRSGLKVRVKVVGLDDNKFSIRTRLEESDLNQTGKCECQSKINEFLCKNLSEILSKSCDVKLRRDKIQDLHNITKTYDKSSSHFIDCPCKPIPQSATSLSPMNNNVFSSFNTPSARGKMAFFQPQDQATPRIRKTSRAKDLFFIKSQRISYDNSDNETPILSIETVVTKKDYKCEMVFKTFSIKMSDGKMEKFQRSFVRSILKCQHKKEHDRDNESEVNQKPPNQTEAHTIIIRPPLGRQSSLKRLSNRLSFSKQKPSYKVFVKEKVDGQAPQTSLLNETPTNPVNIHSVSSPEQTTNPENISTISEPGLTTEKYEKLSDNAMYMDEEEDDEQCIYFEVEDIKNDACGCNIKRLDLSVDFITAILVNRKSDASKIHLESEKYDEKTKHFKDCSIRSPFQKPKNEALARSKTASETSLHSRTHCNSILQNFLEFDKVKCPEERIIDLIKTKNFDEYNMELLNVINISEPSPEMLSLFFYVTRAIIRHIDDPRYENNEDIKKIFKFSEKYLEKTFLTAIQKHCNLMHYLSKYGEVE